MAFRTYTVGRSSKADIRLEDESVSRIHLELTITDAQAYFAIDCHSTQGTFLMSEGVWQPFKQGFVDTSDRLKLGNAQVEIKRLLKQLG